MEESPEVIFEFKAGKMGFDSATRKVKADSRLGKLQILREDPAKVFRWMDRETGQADEDIYVFAQQAIFEKVKQASGRIYVLRYFGSDQRHFFWMQEDDPSQDESLCKKINDIINEEIPEEPSEPMEVAESEPQNSASAPVTDQAARDAQTIATLMQMLAGGMAPKERTPPLTAIITADAINEIANDPECQKVLIPLLPKDQQTPEGLLENLRSPQFLQGLNALTAAAYSGQIEALLASFGLSTGALNTAKDGLDVFLKAIIEKFGKKE